MRILTVGSFWYNGLFPFAIITATCNHYNHSKGAQNNGSGSLLNPIPTFNCSSSASIAATSNSWGAFTAIGTDRAKFNPRWRVAQDHALLGRLVVITAQKLEQTHMFGCIWCCFESSDLVHMFPKLLPNLCPGISAYFPGISAYFPGISAHFFSSLFHLNSRKCLFCL